MGKDVWVEPVIEYAQVEVLSDGAWKSLSATLGVIQMSPQREESAMKDREKKRRNGDRDGIVNSRRGLTWL